MHKFETANNRLFYPALILSSLFLLIPAFYNHYPLVNPDTATYLASGFKPETPFDRPITYGLLIRLFSLSGWSLWPVVFMQAYTVSWLLFKILKNLAHGGTYILKGLLIILFLSLCSGLSWIVSQVQPDVFTSVAFQCIILILMDKESRSTTIFLYVLFFVAVACHLSHPALFIAALLCLFVLKRFFSEKESYGKGNRKILTLAALSIASICVMGAALSKSSHVFFVGSLLEKGVLKKYLDDNCATENYKLCAYKDSLPVSANDFWWNSSSPLYKAGDWKGSKSDFNAIIHGTLTTPLYLQLFLTAAAKQAMEQAVTFNTGDGNVSFPPGSNVNQRVAEYFPGEITSFNNAKQNTTALWNVLTIPNIMDTAAIILCLLAFAGMYATGRRIPKEMNLVFIVCAAGIVLNCLDCAFFGIVNGRYGCKMIWLIPFCTLVYFTMGRSASKRW